PEDVVETAGEGLEGQVDGRAVIVGGRRFVTERLALAEAPQAGGGPGAVTVAVAVDGRWAGELILADQLRAGTPDLLAGLRALGVQRIVLATGDRSEVAEAIVDGLGFDAVHAGLTPERKIAVVVEERAHGRVMMIGDGVNDAPALAAADLGVAMGARGAAASAEAADVVLLVDRLDRILPALKIARQALGIARQSVVAGIGLSVAGMIAAALGMISPVEGALMQEAIDVAVILNALRALRGAT
ncbi:MAG: HAD-IC family P-type ATPase, partial [Paracoccaceae bacterium]|nr:HAD-IC family P-type ATPase [Paracoccaceae bacterium]